MTLIDGVRVSRAWMTRHTPRLLAAWCDAPSPQARRAVAVRILQVAGELESEPTDDPTAPRRTWEAIAESIHPRLVRGPDWAPLAAALDRAAAAGYDVARRLPALAAGAPLPDRHPARELHWRLLEDCPAALPTRGAQDGRAPDAGGVPDVHSPTGSPHIHRDIPPNATHGEPSPRAHPPSREGEPRDR
jgi:hypothetical protein